MDLERSVLTENMRDDKGRQYVETMSNRELLEEMVTNQRATGDLVTAFLEDFKSNPMLKMLGKFS